MNDIATAAAMALPPLSHLECETCGRRQEVGNVADKMSNGWPSCCGYTMRLYTMSEMAQR